MTGGRRQAAPGITEVRLSGRAEDTDAVASALEQMGAGQPVAARIEILTRSAPSPNRRDAGQRVYLLVCVETDPAGGRREP